LRQAGGQRADAEPLPSLAARLECVERLGPILLAVVLQHLDRERVQFLEIRVPAEFRAPKHRENCFWLCFPFYLNAVDFHRREFFFCPLCGSLADDNGNAVVLGACLRDRRHQRSNDLAEHSSSDQTGNNVRSFQARS
jgi:hypothetical protein